MIRYKFLVLSLALLTIPNLCNSTKIDDVVPEESLLTKASSADDDGLCAAPNHRKPPAVDDQDKGHKLLHVSTFVRHGDRTREGYCWADDVEPGANGGTPVKIPPALADSSGFQLKQIDGDASTKERKAFRQFVKDGKKADKDIVALTATGFGQLRQNGKYLRQSYQDLLPECYTKESQQYFSFASTRMSRTVQSANALLHGMFENCEMATKKPPFVILDGDFIAQHYSTCPRIVQEMVKVMVSPDYKKLKHQVLTPLLSSFEATTSTYNEHVPKPGAEFGTPPKHLAVDTHQSGVDQPKPPTSLASQMDCVTTHFCLQQPMPSALSSSDTVRKYQASFYQLFAALNGADTIRKLNARAVLSPVLEQLRGVVSGKSQTKFALFSGHDTQVLHLLFAFKLEDGFMPGYASMVNFELYRTKQGSKVVRLVYNGKALEIPRCGGTWCPWDKFEKLATAAMATADQCASSQGTPLPQLRLLCTTIPPLAAPICN